MVKWSILYTNDGNNWKEKEILESTVVSLGESFDIRFHVSVTGKSISYGFPSIVINEVPISMKIIELNKDVILYESKAEDLYSSKPFLNYFGESTVYLNFDEDLKYEKSISINILAKTENAKIAEEMLSFLNDRYSNIISLCFSKSNIQGGLSNYREPNISIRIQKIQKITKYLNENKRSFELNYRKSWKLSLDFKNHGVLSEESEINWLLQHVDLLYPSNSENANFSWEGKMYNISPVPVEVSKEDTDLYENRVLYSFMLSARSFLSSAKSYYNEYLKKDKIKEASNYKEFIQFDHVIKKFRVKIVNSYIIRIDRRLQEIDNILIWMNKIIPAKTIPNITPIFTKFTQDKYHYQKTFKYIYKWYEMGEPNFEVKDYLMGLRNLSTIYEFICLFSILESLENYGFKLLDQKYHRHHLNIPFGGKKEELPSATPNNLYILEKDNLIVEFFYEPKIFRKSKSSKKGDLINISSTLTKYKDHYYSPDFLLNIKDKQKGESFYCILDAKYKNKNTVKKYDMDNLVKKYLLSIHQLGESNIQNNSIKMVYALFAHKDKGKEIWYYAREHQLSGKYPIFPAIGGILLTPNNRDFLDTLFSQFFSKLSMKWS